MSFHSCTALLQVVVRASMWKGRRSSRLAAMTYRAKSYVTRTYCKMMVLHQVDCRTGVSPWTQQ